MSNLWTRGILGAATLAALGIVSYIVLADIIVCSSSARCQGTNRSDRIAVQATTPRGTSTSVTSVNAYDGNDYITVESTITTNITINGDNGNDIIFDAGGGSTLGGGAGNDIIYGNGGADTISGGAGNDRIFGGDGNDVINGGPGNDIIDPGPGRDGTAAPTSFTNPTGTTTGGGGNDIFILRRGESSVGTEYILCTVNSTDRVLVKLVGYSRNDPALPWQELNMPLTDTNPTPTNFTDILDGANRFRIYHGPGKCKIIVSSH